MKEHPELEGGSWEDNFPHDLEDEAVDAGRKIIIDILCAAQGEAFREFYENRDYGQQAVDRAIVAAKPFLISIETLRDLLYITELQDAEWDDQAMTKYRAEIHARARRIIGGK